MEIPLLIVSDFADLSSMRAPLKPFQLLVLFALVGAPADAAVESALKFGPFEARVEDVQSWKSELSVGGVGSYDVLAAYSQNSGKTRLFAFRRDHRSDRLCTSEFSRMKAAAIEFNKLTAPPGWDCVYQTKTEGRLFGIRPYRIKGKHLSIEFSAVFVAQNLDSGSFVKILKNVRKAKSEEVRTKISKNKKRTRS